MIGGALALVAALLPPEMALWTAIAGLAGAAIVPTAYSYFAWRREHRESTV